MRSTVLRLGCIFAGVGLALCAVPVLHAQVGYEIGQLAPNFTFPDQNGTEISLYDFDGRLRSLHFCAAWCGPCLRVSAEIPVVAGQLELCFGAAAPQFLDLLFQDALGGTTDQADAAVWAELLGVEHPVLHEDGGSAMASEFLAYGFQAIPAFVLVDDAGVILDKTVGVTARELFDQLYDLTFDELAPALTPGSNLGMLRIESPSLVLASDLDDLAGALPGTDPPLLPLLTPGLAEGYASGQRAELERGREVRSYELVDYGFFRYFHELIEAIRAGDGDQAAQDFLVALESFPSNDADIGQALLEHPYSSYPGEVFHHLPENEPIALVVEGVEWADGRFRQVLDDWGFAAGVQAEIELVTAGSVLHGPGPRIFVAATRRPDGFSIGPFVLADHGIAAPDTLVIGIRLVGVDLVPLFVGGDPIALLEELETAAALAGLERGLLTRLASLVEVAQRLLADDRPENDGAVAAALRSWLELLRAQSGKQVPTVLAAELAAQAEAILAALG